MPNRKLGHSRDADRPAVLAGRRLAVAVLLVALVSGCQTPPNPTPTATAVVTAPQTTPQPSPRASVLPFTPTPAPTLSFPTARPGTPAPGAPGAPVAPVVGTRVAPLPPLTPVGTIACLTTPGGRGQPTPIETVPVVIVTPGAPVLLTPVPSPGGYPPPVVATPLPTPGATGYPTK